MLITRGEMTYNFGGARFDLERDREVLGTIFSQLLFSEVAGVQAGRCLAMAPDYQSAQFLARQANDEMAHVKVFLRILDALGVSPQPPNRVLRFFAGEFGAATFLEHVFLQTAVEEGLALTAIWNLIETLPESQARTLLSGVALHEEEHVSFGEEQTLKLLGRDPNSSGQLLGLAVVVLAAISRVSRPAQAGIGGHPVLSHLPGFVRHVERVTELRLRRLGVLHRPLDRVGALERAGLGTVAVARRYGRVLNPLRRRSSALSAAYLSDPEIGRRVHL